MSGDPRDNSPRDKFRGEETADPGARGGITRRELLGAAVAGVGGLLVGAGGAADALAAPVRGVRLPPPGSSGIDHVVVLMMENRSFDHYLGWLPGATGRQAGLSYPDSKGQLHATHHLTTYQGCQFKDPDHSYAGGRIEFNHGKCNGWLLDPANDVFCIGYYLASDLSFYRHAAPYWTVCDHYFAASMAPTFPNRIYMHAAQTDRIDNTYTVSNLPTIWDRLASANVSHNYYFSDVPFTALWGSRLLGITQPISAFYTACKTGGLPAVSFVDPRFQDEGTGTSGDDHPHADIRVGQSFVNQVYQAVTASPNWSRTVLVINYDEWGGFFDHVRPQRAPDAHPQFALRGFRVPAFVISPRARRHAVAHGVYDHTSILKMIEWRWGLQPLTPRDAGARNIAEVLDFDESPNLTAPQWSVPSVVATACGAAARAGAAAACTGPSGDDVNWAELSALASRHGFSRP